MSLVAAEIEKCKVATVCLILLREVAERVRPPRALALPFRHGYPLGKPNDPPTQLAVLEAALELVERPEASAPLLVDYRSSWREDG